MDFRIFERNSDKALYKFGDLADVSYAIETILIPIVSMTTCSRIDNDDDDDDDDDDEYIPAPTSIVPFSSNEMMLSEIFSVLIDPTTDTGHNLVQHDEIKIVFYDTLRSISSMKT